MPAVDDPIRRDFAFEYYYTERWGRAAVRQLRQHRLEWAVALLREHIRPEHRRLLLDVGCGPGEGALTIQRELGPFERVVGLDIDATNALRGLFRALAAANGSASRFLRGSCYALPIPASSVTTMVSFEMLEHLGWRDVFLRETRRVLAPGGLMLLSTPNAGGLHDWLKRPLRLLRGYDRLNRAYRAASDFYERFVSHDELAADLRGAGFEVLELTDGCHVLSVVPDWLLPANAALERSLERTGRWSRAAVTTFVIARRTD
ncbi:MAG: class I SAM-dependent methyltransferase [Gemmatimonadales bacterium]